MQTNIVPVQVFPESANVLMIRAGNLGPPPAYYYQLQNVTVVPGTLAVGVEGEEGYIAAVPDSQQVVVLKDGTVNMTSEQWAAWPADADDDEYQLTAIAANLGLTRA